MLQLAWVKRHDKGGTIELRSKEECSFQLDRTLGPNQRGNHLNDKKNLC